MEWNVLQCDAMKCNEMQCNVMECNVEYVSMYVRMYLCMYACLHACMYLCMHACTHACGKYVSFSPSLSLYIYMNTQLLILCHAPDRSPCLWMRLDVKLKELGKGFVRPPGSRVVGSDHFQGHVCARVKGTGKHLI